MAAGLHYFFCNTTRISASNSFSEGPRSTACVFSWGFCVACLIRFTCRTSMTHTNATSIKLITAMMKLPQLKTASPTETDRLEKSTPPRKIPSIRIQNITHHRFNDCSERAANNDPDGHIHDIATGDEISKFWKPDLIALRFMPLTRQFNKINNKNSLE